MHSVQHRGGRQKKAVARQTLSEKNSLIIAETRRQQVRHITVTEAVSSKAIASMERIEVSESTSNLHV